MKSKQKKIINILIIGAMLSLLNIKFIDFRQQMVRSESITKDISRYDLKSSGYWVLKDTTIIIDDTAPYWSGSINWSTAAQQPWCSGSGTVSDPYVIENLTMIGYDYQACIWIMDSNVRFIIKNCTFMNAGQGLDIWDAIDAKIVNNTFINNSVGVSFSYSQDITISNNKFKDNNAGLSISQGFQYNVSKNSFHNNRNGLELTNDASDSLFYNNTFNDIQYGIYLQWIFGVNNKFSNNTMKGCGLYYYAESPVWAETNIIETNNLVNGKPLYVYYNKSNLNPINFTNAGQVLLIQCNNSQVANLDISNCSIGASMELCKNNTFINSNFSDSGIVLFNSNNITVNNNNITYFGSYGIFLSSGNGHNLTNNQMFNCGLGIAGEIKDMYLNSIDTSNLVNSKPLYYHVNKTGLDSMTFSDAGQLILVDCDDSSIKDFDFSNCYIGITAFRCNNNIFSNITSSFNKYGIILDNCSYNKILNCNVFNCSSYGVQFYSGKNNTMKGSTISKCYYSAISLWGEENRIIENTVIENINYGMYVGGQNNNITDNAILNNGGHGLNLGGSFNIVAENNISSNHHYGINLFGASSNTITQNIISNNKDHGIFSENSNDNVISENQIIENDRSGIFVSRWCDSNDVITNDIKRNNYSGIFLHDDTNFNTIYSNNFTGNLENAIDDGILNEWDNGMIGNYWGDYVGNDTNDDGIGDTPYTNIGGNAGTQDDYPLWWDPPAFSIISPEENQMLGGNAPPFVIEIDAGVPDSMWYILDSSTTKYFFTTNSTLNQGAWDLISSASAIITFYINDSSGIIVSDYVSVRLDKILPIIIINSPHQNEEFGDIAPSFTIIAIDDFLDDIWYTLDNGITNHSCGLSGQIDQILWDILPGGAHDLRFYASDTNGNIGYSQVTIVKTTESVIPSFNLMVILLSVLIPLIGITWFLRKEKIT